MNNISVFFNNQIVDERSHGGMYGASNKKSFSMADGCVGLGNYFLTPVRCLFNGNNVTVSGRNQFVTVVHETEYFSSSCSGPIVNKLERNWLRIIASIVLFVPGLIVGTISKGLGYLSKSIREAHSIVIQHYTPLDITIGTEEERLSLESIIQRLLIEKKGTNPLNQPVRIIVYAEPNTEINDDPGFIAFNPQKIILVGARIIHEPSFIGRLDDRLSAELGWKSKSIRLASDGMQAKFNTFITQWPVNSVKEALQDSPNEERVYVIL